VDADTDLILGATLLGQNAGEIISTLQMAMLGRLQHQQIRDAVLPIRPWRSASACSFTRSTINCGKVAQ
jgi:Pyridine nucleotide-disulphide oxidoreductase, dimerisation domain